VPRPKSAAVTPLHPVEHRNLVVPTVSSRRLLSCSRGWGTLQRRFLWCFFLLGWLRFARGRTLIVDKFLLRLIHRRFVDWPILAGMDERLGHGLEW
jgi:hypothetical protein